MNPFSEPKPSQAVHSQPVRKQDAKRKKPYAAPELKEHGTIQQIIQGSSDSLIEDTFFGFRIEPPVS